jgi:hypothetical protein
MFKIKLSGLLILCILISISYGNIYALNESSDKQYNFIFYVYDSIQKHPIQSAKITLRQKEIIAGGVLTNAAGFAVLRNLDEGFYYLSISYTEYFTFNDTILIDKDHIKGSYGLKSSTMEVESDTVRVLAYSLSDLQPIQINSGYQLFDSKTYHPPPSSHITDLIQENLIGAVKATSGEVHIKGQHGEFTYYLDGLPVPLGVFGGLNEIIDPKVIDRMTFMSGGFPAEYGGQIAAVMDIQTVVPSGHFHLDFSTYGGSYLVFNGAPPFKTGLLAPTGHSSDIPGDTLGGKVGPFRALNSNGQSLSISDHIGMLGYFLSFSRQETDRRIDQPVPALYNDHGLDYFLFGKLNYLFSENDFLTVNFNYSDTKNQVPFDIFTQGNSPDNQSSFNSFQTFSFTHIISSETNNEKELFIGFFARQGGLNYQPSPVSPSTFQFIGDSDFYKLTEDRTFNSFGLKIKYESRLSSEFKYDLGINFSITNGIENFTSVDSLNHKGPSSYTDFTGSDFGFFVQEEYRPLDFLRIDAGIRYDQHIAPDMSLQSQMSPRIKLNLFLNEQNTMYLYYGSLFMPTNIEGIRNLALNVSSGGNVTLPEKTNLYEIGYIHAFTIGLNFKSDVFYKYSSPGIDDQTVGSSAVKVPVNIQTIRTSGIEAGISYNHPKLPITGILNAAMIHAYGSGLIRGGFLPFDNDGETNDLDHDQRLSISAELNYQPENWFINISSIYGSGLTNGNPENIAFGKGLFDFNSEAHVTPYVIFNIAGGFHLHINPEKYYEFSLYINNLFDRDYLLKGSYFSGAAYGERRNVVLKLALHI